MRVLFMEETEQKVVQAGEGKKVYELAYLFVPTIPEEQIAGKITGLKDLVNDRGGVFISEDFARYMELAYRMERVITNKKEKFTSAYFGWIKFELEPEKIAELNAILMRNEEIIRYLLIKTVRENTLVSKRPVNRDIGKKRSGTEDEPKVELDKEEVDAQIEAMVKE
jgi:ribosomal protein S6